MDYFAPGVTFRNTRPYHLTGTTRPYGYVVQDKDAGRPNADGDATVTATRLDDDTTVAERVSFDEAKSALEQHAQQHATWM